MKYGFKVLHTNSRDLKSTLLYLTQNHMYLFSWGDGVQRILLEQNIKLNRINHIFVPDTTGDHFWGIPGYFMSTLDSLPEELAINHSLDIFGPSSIKEVMNQTKYFMGFHKGIFLNEYSEEPRLSGNLSYSGKKYTV